MCKGAVRALEAVHFFGDGDEVATASDGDGVNVALFFALPTLRLLPDDESGGPVSADVAGLLRLRVTAMSSDDKTTMLSLVGIESAAVRVTVINEPDCD